LYDLLPLALRRGLLSVALLAPTLALAGTSAGQELFSRTWLPWDSRVTQGGDGLGPMYNASSCGACHNQGGVGGAGPREHNVRLTRLSEGEGFVVEHRLSTLSSRELSASSTRIERNTPALFGAGLIDAIPVSALFALESVQEDGGVVSGRVPMASDGKAGRFGWKGHTSSLEDFVATACANELGLSVERHSQASPPPGDLSERLALMQQAVSARGSEQDLQSGPGLDMTPKEVVALTAFVRSLPRPVELESQPRRDAGLALLKSTGCESCHVQNVGPVEGIYSDLLLHDMGNRLSDAAGDYRTRGNEAPVAIKTPPNEPPATRAGATEWRTPPLWGIRDSAPYLHDGRAGTLDEAIRSHEGEARPATEAYLALPITDQQLLIAFLESLVAPG
jgi:CxxC motif-containing protein (DUF1111 family)